jgi:hypothetical protein
VKSMGGERLTRTTISARGVWVIAIGRCATRRRARFTMRSATRCCCSAERRTAGRLQTRLPTSRRRFHDLAMQWPQRGFPPALRLQHRHSAVSDSGRARRSHFFHQPRRLATALNGYAPWIT